MSNQNTLKNLNYLGINNAEQLEKKDLNYWWRIKYKENKDNAEVISKLDQIIDELEQLPKEDLISLLLNEQINLLKEKDRNLKKNLDQSNDLQDRYIPNLQEDVNNQKKDENKDIPISEYKGSPQFQEMMAKMKAKEEIAKQLAEQIKIFNDQENILIEKEKELIKKSSPLKDRKAILDNKLMTLRNEENWREFRESRKEFLKELKKFSSKKFFIGLIILPSLSFFLAKLFGIYGFLVGMILIFAYEPIINRLKKR